jgi:hypothetical protein
VAAQLEAYEEGLSSMELVGVACIQALCILI